MAEQARVAGFREETRGARMRIADEAQPAFRRAVSWGAECGGTKILFTTTGVPVMTRLRMADRRVLDTLIDAGVARSRSEALAWCVRLVAQHEQRVDRRAACRHDGRRGGPQPGPQVCRVAPPDASPRASMRAWSTTTRSKRTSASRTARCARRSPRS